MSNLHGQHLGKGITIEYGYQQGQTENTTWTKLSIFVWSPITVSLQLHNQIGDILSFNIGLLRNAETS